MEKKPYKVIKPVGIDGRKEIGEIVQLTDEEAQQIGSEYVVPESESASADENTKVEENPEADKPESAEESGGASEEQKS